MASILSIVLVAGMLNGNAQMAATTSQQPTKLNAGEMAAQWSEKGCRYRGNIEIALDEKTVIRADEADCIPSANVVALRGNVKIVGLQVLKLQEDLAKRKSTSLALGDGYVELPFGVKGLAVVADQAEFRPAGDGAVLRGKVEIRLPKK